MKLFTPIVKSISKENLDYTSSYYEFETPICGVKQVMIYNGGKTLEGEIEIRAAIGTEEVELYYNGKEVYAIDTCDSETSHVAAVFEGDNEFYQVILLDDYIGGRILYQLRIRDEKFKAEVGDTFSADGSFKYLNGMETKVNNNFPVI